MHLLLELLAPAAILADEKGEKAARACGFTCIRYEKAILHPVDQEKLLALRRRASVYDPMSILYTSDSTGIPKGSVQTHFSYLHWTEATIDVYGLTESTVFGNQSPFFYANSILDIFPPVALGATVYLLPSGVLTFPKKLIQCLNEHHIYGSTEMFSVAVGKVDRNHQNGDRLPVGKPFSLAHILFVDENGEEAPAGVPGEMLVSSPWIASGYHRDKKRTAASWIDDPLARGTLERFFRGGDMGYIREDGQMMVLGRRDSQIKHMGYRMEIGEVEEALHTLPGWQEGCVLFDAENDRLWCFYTGSLEEKQIKAGLKEKLARYLLPDRYVRLDESPIRPP